MSKNPLRKLRRLLFKNNNKLDISDDNKMHYSDCDSLDIAWDTLELDFESRQMHENNEFFIKEYNVPFESLEWYFDVIMKDEKINKENLLSLWILGFELGKAHEKYEREMEGDIEI